MQVLERECEPDVLAKKRAKLEGKRKKAFPKVHFLEERVEPMLAYGPALCGQTQICEAEGSVPLKVTKALLYVLLLSSGCPDDAQGVAANAYGVWPKQASQL